MAGASWRPSDSVAGLSLKVLTISAPSAPESRGGSAASGRARLDTCSRAGVAAGRRGLDSTTAPCRCSPAARRGCAHARSCSHAAAPRAQRQRIAGAAAAHRPAGTGRVRAGRAGRCWNSTVSRACCATAADLARIRAWGRPSAELAAVMEMARRAPSRSRCRPRRCSTRRRRSRTTWRCIWDRVAREVFAVLFLDGPAPAAGAGDVPRHAGPDQRLPARWCSGLAAERRRGDPGAHPSGVGPPSRRAPMSSP